MTNSERDNGTCFMHMYTYIQMYIRAMLMAFLNSQGTMLIKCIATDLD